MWRPLQFGVAVERVITSFTLGMDGHPTFKKFFYFTLGIGAFAVIISVSLILTGENNIVCLSIL